MTKEELMGIFHENGMQKIQDVFPNWFSYQIYNVVLKDEILEILEEMHGAQLFKWKAINIIDIDDIQNPNAVWDYARGIFYFKNEHDMLFIKLKYG